MPSSGDTKMTQSSKLVDFIQMVITCEEVAFTVFRSERDPMSESPPISYKKLIAIIGDGNLLAKVNIFL